MVISGALCSHAIAKSSALIASGALMTVEIISHEDTLQALYAGAYKTNIA